MFRRAGYRVEKLVYESRPGFYVTGLLYVPEPAGPNVLTTKKFPVILDVHGHWAMKKQQAVVQARCIFQALHGYVALCIDTPGHSFEADDAPIERRWQGQHNDWALLLGSANTTALYAWDGIRALDYLETRPECDMSKVGITGASGGGLATLYNFVADERIKVAVPVVYATSLEVNPYNGCLCNHVPATLQVGDRSDLLAIRAPQPILVIGATNDTEFPPAGTQKTGEKLRAIYKLFGKEEDAQWKVFPGGHDYNQAMQELAIGFFDKHLKGIGDGSPVPRPEFKTEDEKNPEMLAMPGGPPAGALTQRDISLLRLRAAAPHTWEETVKTNGGLPDACPLEWKETPSGVAGKYYVTFQSEKGLTIPAVFWTPPGKAKAAVVLIGEGGKLGAPIEFGVADFVKAGYACLGIDARGSGELTGLDQRLMTYLGTAEAFAMGWDVAQAARGLKARGLKTFFVVGRGAVASQAAMFSALFEPSISGVVGADTLRSWEDVLADGIPDEAVMPRADLCASLSDLRSWVKPKAAWHFRSETPLDIVKVIERFFGG
jgi:cephalosporin-C deacetylase-like acetyl esterase